MLTLVNCNICVIGVLAMFISCVYLCTQLTMHIEFEQKRHFMLQYAKAGLLPDGTKKGKCPDGGRWNRHVNMLSRLALGLKYV